MLGGAFGRKTSKRAAKALDAAERLDAAELADRWAQLHPRPPADDLPTQGRNTLTV